jgi:hypothetical protein
MATLIERTNILKLVTTMFNAAPGATYLADFVTFFDATGGTSAQKLAALGNALARTGAYQAINPSFQVGNDFAISLLTPFGLQANQDALDFVNARLSAGMSKGQIAAEAMTAIDTSTGTAFADAKAVLANKATVSEYYSVTKATAQLSLAALQSVLVGVTSSAATVTAANASIDVVTAPTPQIFTLTTGADTGTLFTGGAANDTFNALFTTANGMTFGANDILDGGAGTDTLFIQVGVTGVAGPATIRNIEVITTNFSAAGTVNLLGATGVTTVESNGSSADATFTNIASATTALRVSNTANGANFGFTAAAVAGAADTANVTLNAATAGTLTLTTGFETVAFRSSGSANTLAGLTIGAPTTVTVAGDQALVLGTIAAPATLPLSVTTFDASANTATAGVTATFGATTTATAITGSTGNDTLNITNIVTTAVNLVAGAGNDVVIDNSTISAVTTMTGGDGTDTLVTIATSAEGYVTPAVRTITGFERVQESTPGTAAGTLTLANLDTGITNVTLGAGTAAQGTGIGAAGAFASTAGAYTISAPTGTLGLTLQGALGGALTIVAAGTATTDTANITVSPSTAVLNVLAGQNIVDTQFETLNISTGSAATSGAQTTGTVAITASTGGTSRLNITGVNAFSGTTLTAVTIDASGMTGAATFTNTGAGATTTSITGTANADVIVGGSAAATLSGGAGADTITGGAGNDSISGGDGADSITGGLGRDTLTGGAGVDTFVFAANATGAVTSNQAAPDTITDFVSGTDKISLGQTVTAFLGNYTSLSSAQAAVAADGRTNLAFFVTGENTLYVTAAATGIPAATDTVIFLTGVTSLAATDILQLGAQGGGATVSLTAAAANLSNTSQVNASGATTASDDAISSTAAFLSNSTITGGTGNDTLTISTDPTAAGATGTGSTTFTLQTAGAGTGAVVSGIEVISLTAGNTANALTVTNDVNLAVRNASTTATAIVQLGTGTGQNFTGTGSGIQTVALGGASQSVTTGTGADQISATASQLLNSTIAGGAGADTLTITGLSTALTLSSTAASAAAALMTGIETVAVTVAAGFTTLTLVPDAPLTVNFTGAVAEAVASTGSTVTIGQVAAQTLGLSGTSNYVVSGGTTGAITSNGSGTLSVTGSANAQTITSASATTINALALGAIDTIGGTGAFTVTGLGTVAAGQITEAAGHTGALTVTTAGTNASTITEVVGATAVGTVTINQAGTLALTVVATVNHGATNVIASGVNSLAISGAGVLNYTQTGNDAHTIVSTTTGAAGDTVVGGSGVDTVTLGVGPDRFTTGGGADIITVVALTDTGIVSGFSAGAAAPVNGQNVNTSQLDIITGFSAGASIRMTGAGFANATYAIVRNGATNIGTDTANNLVMLSGSYASATNIFTVDTAGTSTLVVYDDTGDAAGGAYRGIVLVGYLDTGAADTFITTGNNTMTLLSV